jgi:hypothetical protein
MNEPTMNEITPAPLSMLDEKPKHSGIGIASFASSVLALLGICSYFAMVGVLSSTHSAAVAERISSLSWVIVALFCLVGIATMVGLGLGIAAVVQKGTNKTFGILGLVFSGLIMLTICLLLIFGFGLFALLIASFPGLQGMQNNF